ncbi:MAG TPA: hypothetical protein VGR14_22430 [Verrucomicrobiae bacterium]|jgi:hypothetical protein|nr:hypothetical protein [Verrucomicrobiae bacterium]
MVGLQWPCNDGGDAAPRKPRRARARAAAHGLTLTKHQPRTVKPRRAAPHSESELGHDAAPAAPVRDWQRPRHT